MIKRNINNVSWALVERVVQIILAMFFTGLVARYFGVETFGAYQFATSVLLVATSLTWLCPAEMFYGRLNQRGGLPGAMIVTSIYYRFLISVIVFIGASLYVIFKVDDVDQKAFILILSVSLLYSEPLGIYRFLIETQGGFRHTARLRMACALIKVAAVYLLVEFQAGNWVVLLPVIAETASVCVGCLWIFKKQGGSIAFPFSLFDAKLAVQFLREGSRYWIGLVGMCFFLRVDRFHLEGKLSALDFGAYSAAISLLEQFTSVATMLVAVLAPIVVFRSSAEKATARLLMFAAVMVVFSICGATFLFVISSDLIKLLFGSTFSGSNEIFKFAILFSPIIYLDAALTTLLLREKATSIFAIKGLSAFGVASYVNYFHFAELGWRSGVWGYGLGWATSLAFTIAYFVWYCRKMHERRRIALAQS